MSFSYIIFKIINTVYVNTNIKTLRVKYDCLIPNNLKILKHYFKKEAKTLGTGTNPYERTDYVLST